MVCDVNGLTPLEAMNFREKSFLKFSMKFQTGALLEIYQKVFDGNLSRRLLGDSSMMKSAMKSLKFYVTD